MEKSKIQVLFLIVTLCLLSCGKNNQYTLRGFLPYQYEGCKVYMFPVSYYFSFEKEKLQALDSTIVHEGRFCFQGIADNQPQMFVITIAGMKKAQFWDESSVPVVVEAGNIHVVYDTLGIWVSGTPVNERYSDLILSGKRAMLKERHALDFVRDSIRKVNGDADDWYRQEYQAIYKKNVVIPIEKFVKENAGNPVGDYFYFQCASIWYSKEFVDSVYPLISSELRQKERAFMKLREQRVEMLKRGMDSTAIGVKYKDIVGFTSSGEKVWLSDFVGKKKLVLLDFWASWCRPCVGELSLLRKLYQKYEKKGLVIFGFSLDTKQERWLDALEKYQVVGVQVSDLKGWNSQVCYDYGLRSIPHVLLIDKEGKIVRRNVWGRFLEKALEEYFETEIVEN